MNITDLLQELRILYAPAGTHKNVRYGWIGLDCPWCGTIGRQHLGIRLGDLRCTCWQCGGHRLGDTLAAVTGAPIRDAMAWVQRLDRPVGAPDSARVASQRPSRLLLPTGMRRALGGPHAIYLRKRGFDPGKIIETWGVGVIERAARLPWRIWVPVVERAREVSWTTRAIGDGTGSKYISARPEEELVPIKDVLYGADLASSAVVVCEGPLDVWAIGPGAVATMGVGYSPVQIWEIGSYPVRAICFDSEKGAQRRAERLANTLSGFPGETHVIMLETGKDPPECEPGEIEEIRERFLQ